MKLQRATGTGRDACGLRAAATTAFPACDFENQRRATGALDKYFRPSLISKKRLQNIVGASPFVTAFRVTAFLSRRN